MMKRLIYLRNEYYWLTIISVYFFVISVWILPPGIPGGIDTNSHLFKIMYISKYGLFLSWCHAWYSGYPFLLFYPPLSYYMAAIIAPNNPLLSLKIISIIFFTITPSSVYFLARNLNFNKKESILAAFLLGISPVFIMNLLYYGRYPNVIAFPLVCLSLGSLIYSYKKSSSFIFPGLVMGLLILIHHLSAFIGFFLILLFSIFEIIYSRNFRMVVQQLVLVTLTALAIGAAWVIPFFANISYYGRFQNPSMPILSLKFLLRFYISMIGLAHIILSIGVFLLILFYQLAPKKVNWIRKLLAVVSFAVIIFYTLYSFLNNGFTFTIKHMVLILICVIILLFIYLLPQFTTSPLQPDINIVFSFSWFTLFFWLTLGPRAILFVLFPFSQSLDILRFMLYASIPVSLLGARMLIQVVNSALRMITIPNKLASFLLLTLLSISFIAPYIQPRYGQTGMLYVDDIFRRNQEVPQSLITYLHDSDAYGRILSIHSPSWIYSLPYYTNKPLIDGWFPQARFLYPFQNLTSYNINELISSEEWVYEYLLQHASLYGIKWVLIDGEDKLQLIQPTQFQLVLHIDSLYLYENSQDISFIDIKKGKADITYERPHPNTIVIKVEKTTQNIELLLKEVYFPYWQAETTENNVELKKSEIGFMLLSIDSDTMIFEIRLFYKYPFWQRFIPIFISIFAVLICCIGYFKPKHFKQIQVRFKNF